MSWFQLFRIPEVRLSPLGLVVGLVVFIWSGALIKTWVKGVAVSLPPRGAVWSCEMVSGPEAGSHRGRSVKIEGVVWDPEDGLFPRELAVSLNGIPLAWVDLRTTAISGIYQDPVTGLKYREWSLVLPITVRSPGIQTIVVEAVDTQDQRGELGRCQFDLPGSAKP